MNEREIVQNALDLMALHAGALFTFDAQGRMVTTNEPEPERAPRIYLGITEEGIIPHYRDDLPHDVVHAIDRFLATIVERPEVRQLPALVLQVGQFLESDAPVTSIEQGSAWRFPEALSPSPDPVAIGQENAGILNQHFPFTADHLAERAPCFAIVEDDVAVSACYSSRNAPHVAEAGVETIPTHRGRGYAPRVIAAWARAVRDEGRIPLYSASGLNTASRAVASTLGLVMYGLDISLR